MISRTLSRDGSSNTRLNLETKQRLALLSHLDYLRVFVKVDTYELLTELCQYCIGDEYITESITWRPFGGKITFDNKITSPLGVTGGWINHPETGIYEICLQFAGAFFELKSNVDVWRMIRGLEYTYKARCTRIDTAIDDLSYEIIPVNFMIQETLKGNTFGFRSYKFINSGDNTSQSVRSNSSVSSFISTQIYNVNNEHFIANSNMTIYLGSRNSGKMVRIYDHDSECLRFETEYKRRYAREVFSAIASFERGDNQRLDSTTFQFVREPSAWLNVTIKQAIENLGNTYSFEDALSKLIGGIGVSAIDFRNKQKVKNRSKASVRDTERFYWWDEFIDNIGFYLKVKLPKKTVKTIEKSVAWVHKQVAPTLAMIRKAKGAQAFKTFLLSILEQGEERLSTYQEFIISLYRNYQESS